MLKGYSGIIKRIKAVEQKTAPPKLIILNVILRNGTIRTFTLKK